MDERIVAALAESPPPDTASDRTRCLWEKLTDKLAEYDECVAAHRSGEGLTLSMSKEACAAQVAEYHAAYLRLLRQDTVAPGTNPALLAPPRGFCVDYSRGEFHRL